MTKNILSILILTVFLIPLDLFSQANPISLGGQKEPLFMGPVAGYSNVNHATNAEVITNDPTGLCPSFSDGSQSGFYVGWTFEYQLGGAKNSKSSVIGKIVYNHMPTSLEEEGTQLPVQDRAAGTGEITLSSVNYINELTYSNLALQLFYKFNFAGGLGVIAGPSIDYNLNVTTNQRMDLIQPTNATFIDFDPGLDPNGYILANGGRSIVFADGDLEGAGTMRFAIIAGLQYEILMDGYFIVPHILYNFGLNNLTTESDWRVSALHVGVDVRLSAKSIAKSLGL